MALPGAFQRPAQTEDSLTDETEVLPAGVKLKLSRRCGQGMAIQDDYLFARPGCQLLQAFAQFQFFRSKQLMTESAELAESRSFAKNKRAGQIPGVSAEQIPAVHDPMSAGRSRIQSDGAAAGQAGPA